MEPTSKNDKALIGQLGEAAVAEYLRQNLYQLIARNWRKGRYEIDLIVARAGVLHFVEVKTRKADGLTTPEAAITRQKRLALRNAANAFLASNEAYYRGYEIHFDLAAVLRNPDGTMQVDWIEDAIEYGW